MFSWMVKYEKESIYIYARIVYNYITHFQNKAWEIKLNRANK